ncbi:MAG: hypothetical protein KGM15_00475 [Pseudomonadota bacterium]|nr:hypothetical protein [Pseudomonadota bacterium]
MPDAAPDPMAKWTPVPDWSGARLARPGWTAAPVSGLFQTLLSGDLSAAFATLSPAPASIGLWAIAASARAAIRIGRDRALLVATEPVALATGWRAGGWAASDASDAYAVIDIAGRTLREIIAEATSAEVEAGSASAAISFADVPALLYRLAADHARVHVEACFAPYLWRWLETR